MTQTKVGTTRTHTNPPVTVGRVVHYFHPAAGYRPMLVTHVHADEEDVVSGVVFSATGFISRTMPESSYFIEGAAEALGCAIRSSRGERKGQWDWPPRA